ncbi:phosphatidate cytidylyltransferase [Clostridium thermarum]|uniref:phosphatidate cytidylyltransferase n=1 Tax=Clostridium thermarum TaxID=1716543 RepID=UPI0013D83E42|nr:phosphatidate cytidylyltransferase [Clostridium thermarum]
MNNRYVGALLISPFIIIIYLGGYYLVGFTMVLALLGMHEFLNAVKKSGSKPFSFICYAAAVVYYALLILNRNSNHIDAFLIMLTLVLLCIPVINTKYNFIDAAISLLCVLYVAVFFSFIPLINLKPFGNILVWLVFITSWSCDTTAYYFGRFFGKTKLCPKVSPKKTIEGSLGGILGSTLITFAFGYMVESNYNIMPIANYAVIGILCGIISQFGDLVASSIKRYVDIKDYSKLIPGHGGILDRFDSIMYSSVVIFYYLTIVVKI